MTRVSAEFSTFIGRTRCSRVPDAPGLDGRSSDIRRSDDWISAVASLAEALKKLLERLMSSVEIDVRLWRLRTFMHPSIFLICFTTSLQFVIIISVMSLATCILSTSRNACCACDSSTGSLVFFFSFFDLGEGDAATRNSPVVGSDSLTAWVPRMSPTRRGPNTIPRALYPMRSDVGKGRPNSSSLGAVSAVLPRRQRRPKTAQINSLLY